MKGIKNVIKQSAVESTLWGISKVSGSAERGPEEAGKEQSGRG